MAKFRAGPRFEERVAARWAVPEARRLADQLADRVRANVPDAGVWITRRDERVRHTHVNADGQTIPINLRYLIEHPSLADTYEMARAPGDEELSLANRINCRCIPALLPGVIAEHVAASDVALRGAKAAAVVSVTFPRIVESEYPGPEDGGGGWLRRSVEEAAAARGISR
jgi:hypothetical protein